MALVSRAIFLTVLAAVLICAVVVLLFAMGGCDGDDDDPESLPACVMKYPRGTMPTVAPGDQITQDTAISRDPNFPTDD